MERNGVNGGEVVFTLPGTPERVVEMVLDFHHDAEHRPWRTVSRLLSRNENRYRAEAQFEGPMGIHPTGVLVYEVEHTVDGFFVRFHVEEPTLGLSAPFHNFLCI